MTLDEYDHGVGFNLQMIREAAASCLFYTDRLIARPDFETLALDDLRRLKLELLRAMFTVMKAEATYHGKPKTGIGA
jgi:hypothetical protein